MRKQLEIVVLVVVLGALIYVERSHISFAYKMFQDRFAPCSTPIAYSVGEFDSRFGISEKDFKDAIVQAEGLWEKAAGKQLFNATPSGSLKINLVYDSRQADTVRLKKLGLVVSTDRASYDQLKSKYDSMEIAYASKKAIYDRDTASFTKAREAYDAEVSMWNSRGGAPRDVYTKLQTEKSQLASQLTAIRAQEASLQDQVDTINALVGELNRVATALNITASEFNKVGSSRGEEFTEGEYESSAQGEKIDIYQFDTKAKLIRVLAHELGHALSLDHVDDPKAIMYRLNQGTNETLTAADISELHAHCGL